MTKFNPQMSLSHIHDNINKSFDNKPSALIDLIENNINFDDFIPYSFKLDFYKKMGRSHIYHLESFIRALFLQNILGIPSDTLLINILNASNELRIFCRFDNVPDPSQFSRFRANYINNLADLFNRLVDITEPICRKINKKKADYLIYDTSGIELPVFENNPKFLDSKLKEAKKISSDNPDFNPYAAVYNNLPDSSKTNSDARQQYINGHFCYALKFGILTNGIGIPRHIVFFDEDFKKDHPDIICKKTNNPNVDKEIADSKSLKPVLTDFQLAHPELKFNTFLADSAFDSYDIFAMLKDKFHFSRVCIPLNKRNTKLDTPNFNEFGIPVCPVTKIPFIYQGLTQEQGRSTRFKWVCDKSKPCNKGIFCCDSPCTTSKYGRCIYTSLDDNFRLYPGIPRGTEHWKNLYRHRVQVERTINLIKDTFSVNYRKTHNTISIKANIYLAAITQLLGVILSAAIKQLDNFKSIRKLIAS